MKSFVIVVAFRKAGWFGSIKRGERVHEEVKLQGQASSLLAAGVLGDSLGPLRDGVLGELAWKVKPHGSLDFATGDGVLLVVVSQAGGLGGDTLEDVAHERVHDAHGFGGDTSVGVDLLQHLVDVDGVALLAGLPALLGIARWLALDGGLLLAFLGSNFARHGEFVTCFVGELRKTMDEMNFGWWASGAGDLLCESGGSLQGRITFRLTNQIAEI